MHYSCASVSESASSAFTAMLMNETPLVSATRDKGEQTARCVMTGEEERRSSGFILFTIIFLLI